MERMNVEHYKITESIRKMPLQKKVCEEKMRQKRKRLNHAKTTRAITATNDLRMIANPRTSRKEEVWKSASHKSCTCSHMCTGTPADQQRSSGSRCLACCSRWESCHKRREGRSPRHRSSACQADSDVADERMQGDAVSTHNSE